jgi:hypothetical protein
VIPSPIALGLTLCDYVIVERHTGKVSLIGNLTEFTSASFPFVAPRFFAYAALTEGSGEGTLEIVVTSLNNNEQAYAQSTPVSFPDRLDIVDGILGIKQCRFPSEGWYEFVLLVDEEEISRRRIHVRLKKERS